jgi:Ca2+-transporting ATPase
VFEAEASEEDAMSKPPRDPQAPLFDASMLGTALLIGASMLGAVAVSYAWAIQAGYTEAEVRAIGFAAIVFGNLFLILATRSSERSIFAVLTRPNAALWWVIVAALAALALALYVPPVAQIFRFEALSAGALLAALAAGAVALLAVEALKLAHNLKKTT